MQNGKTTLKVSDQIELRLPDPNFAEELFKIIDSQRDYFRNWLAWVDGTHTIEDSLRFLKTAKIFNQGGQRLTCFVFYNGKMAGSIGLVKINKTHKHAEIGYWLRADLQGNGIMIQSCRTLMDYAFKHLDLNRLEINAASTNLKSLAIPKKLGFIHEATLREALLLYGDYHNLELFAILKKDHSTIPNPQIPNS